MNAENIIMKSNMQYVIFILVLFALQILAFTNFKEYESGVRAETVAYENLKIQNEKLMFELSALKTDSNRSPASIQSSAAGTQNTNIEPIDMSEFYFSKYRESYGKKQNEQALKYLEKVKSNSLNAKSISKALYYKLEIQCKSEINDLCLADIDVMVTQYPDSEWTGKSLELLKNYYDKHQRRSEASVINDIIQKNFAKNQKNTESKRL